MLSCAGLQAIRRRFNHLAKLFPSTFGFLRDKRVFLNSPHFFGNALRFSLWIQVRDTSAMLLEYLCSSRETSPIQWLKPAHTATPR
jgi:hypothetical protein